MVLCVDLWDNQPDRNAIREKTMSKILALDIGGANIKVADGQSYARSWPFELWKSPDKLADKLRGCLIESPSHDRLVVTMTGELCDCFETKREGVRHIVDATVEAAGDTPVLFYQTTGEFVSADEACEKYLLTAASNWRALATFAARYCDGKPGMLIDIGSTTTDIIPIVNGKEAARGRTDSERLGKGELVYMGVERTPICSIIPSLQWRDVSCRVAQEWFATAGDVYLLLGDLREDLSNTNTADGKPFTCDAAHARMARMICGDRELVTRDEVISFATQVRENQIKFLLGNFFVAVGGMRGVPRSIIVSGQGEFLVYSKDGSIFERPTISLNELLGPEISRCATAHALAVIASELL
jgi:probable H4MPT-linked C1 transfer pathway protein